MLIGSAMVAMGFTGYNAGVGGASRHIADLVMSIMIATLIVRPDPDLRAGAHRSGQEPGTVRQCQCQWED
jgi:hypothetical protein